MHVKRRALSGARRAVFAAAPIRPAAHAGGGAGVKSQQDGGAADAGRGGMRERGVRQGGEGDATSARHQLEPRGWAPGMQGGRLFRGLDNALLLYEPGAQARDGRGAKVESNAVGHVALRQPNAGGTPSELLIHTALRDRPCCICRFVLWFLGSNT